MIPTNKGGSYLVATPWIVFSFSLPAAGLFLDLDVPAEVTLAGLEFDAQALELDAGASHGIAFTPGIEFILGG